MTAVQTKQTRDSVKSYPATEELAVPTDLGPEEVEKIVNTINPLVADAFALFLKTKNFHWHVASVHFRDFHILFDEQAEAIMASIDPLAERVRRLGGLTIRSVGQIAELQTIEDQNADYLPPEDMINELLKDNQQIARAQREAIEVCEENRDTPTANILQELLDGTERRIWFLHEMSMGYQNGY